MKLTIFRHAIAADREEFAQTGRPDDERPLIKKGEKKLEIVLSAVLPLIKDASVILTSPLLRAKQTSQYIQDALKTDNVKVYPELSPDRSPVDLINALNSFPDDNSHVIIVGHEPHLGRLIGWLLSGDLSGSFVLKKSGICQIECERPLAAKSAQLSLFSGPKEISTILNREGL